MTANTQFDIDLSVSPYFDDYNNDSDYYKILVKPSEAIQTRELNQMQSILQQQISRFGRNIYKEGSIVEGCTLSFDNNRPYVKISDTFTNTTVFTVNDFNNFYVKNNNGLTALIVDTIGGYVSQNPNTNTLYVKYINSALFSNGSPQSVFSPSDLLTIKNSSNGTIGQVLVADVSSPTGYGYAMSTTSGIIFKKSIFCYVANQSVLVSRYSNVPDGVLVGFDANETIVTAQSNNSLYDNAAGSFNYAAPGADRFSIVPKLVVRNQSDVANNSSFFTIASFIAGSVVTINQTASYSGLGQELARRTYETNGDFVINPFNLSTQSKANTLDPLYTNYVNLFASRGKGYVEGYRVEYLNNDITDLRRGIDFQTTKQQTVSLNFGNYFYVNELSGGFGSSTQIIQVQLHSIPKTSVTSSTLLSTGYSNSTLIGTAYVKGLEYDSNQEDLPNSQYRLYLFNIYLYPGQNLNKVQSVLYISGGGLKGVADVVLSYNPTSNNYIAQLNDVYDNSLIYPFGQRAIKVDGFNNTKFTYKKTTSTQFLSTGNASITLQPSIGSAIESFPFYGNLTNNQKQYFHVVATTSGTSNTHSGTVQIIANTNSITGNNTVFLSQYLPGDYIGVNGEYHLVKSISNNVYLNTFTNFASSVSNTSHSTVYPVGSVVPFYNRNDRAIIVTANTITFNLGSSAPSNPFSVDIFYYVDRASALPIQKILNQNTFVKINCSTHPKGKLGPWCLGLTDVFSIDGVYINSSSNNNYSNTTQDFSANFTLYNGQTDTDYRLSSLSVNSFFSALSVNATILVQLSHFTYNNSQGLGFFTANSYPVDDTGNSNNSIYTQDIPIYTSQKNNSYDLRDCVDFRPFQLNTAIVSNNISLATVNPSSKTSYSTSNLYLPVADTIFQTDLQYYLPRVDLATIDISGNLKVIEGVPSSNIPLPPNEPPLTMSLGYINVPPYPSLSTDEAQVSNRYDYAITSTPTQNRRYTMRDIGTLDNRIKNLEYYTSLSLLEQSTTNLLLKNGTTGQTRFKNGIFVEPFQGFDLCNTLDPNFKIAIDPSTSTMRPAFTQMRVQDLVLDTIRSVNVQQHGELILLNHTSNNVYINQPYASKYRNCIEGNVFEWLGVLSLSPAGSYTPDITQGASVVNNIDLASNWVNLTNSAWGTQWGNWVDVGAPSIADVSSTSSTSSSKDSSGGTNIVTTTQTTRSSSQTQQRNSQQLSTTITNSALSLGTFLTGATIQPYLPASVISFSAKGLKPNTRVYAYFAKTPVSNCCIPSTIIRDRNNNISITSSASNLGQPLITDSFGNVYGIFYIPANTFAASDNVFEINDISDLSQGASSIQTTAQATFYGSKLSFTSSESILNTRNAVLNVNEIQSTQQVVSYSSSSNTTSQYINPPFVPPVVTVPQSPAPPQIAVTPQPSNPSGQYIYSDQLRGYYWSGPGPDPSYVDPSANDYPLIGYYGGFGDSGDGGPGASSGDSGGSGDGGSE